MEVKKIEYAEHGLDSLKYVRRIETSFVEDGTFEYVGTAIKDSKSLASLFRRIGMSDREKGVVVFFNHDYVPIGYDLWLGGIDFVSIDPRRIMTIAGLVGAAKIAIAHNHPSGDCLPSGADEAFCVQISQICGLLSWELVDFQIIAGDNYFSFKENNHPVFTLDFNPIVTL